MNYCTYLTVQIFSRLSKKYIGISDHNLPAMSRISIIPTSAQIKTGSTTWHGPNDSPKRLTQPIPAQHNLSISIIPNYCSSSMRQRDRRMHAGCRCSSFCSVSWSSRGQNRTVKQTSMKKKRKVRLIIYLYTAKNPLSLITSPPSNGTVLICSTMMPVTCRPA